MLGFSGVINSIKSDSTGVLVLGLKISLKSEER